jgi:hypothetical protein
MKLTAGIKIVKSGFTNEIVDVQTLALYNRILSPS